MNKTSQRRKIKLGDRLIGDGEPVFITVEAGTTCNGCLNTALQMVDAAVEAGADAIKFMLIDPDGFMSSKQVQYTYEWAGGKNTVNMYDMFKGLTFSIDEWDTIFIHCLEKQIIFYLTVDTIIGLEEAEKINCHAYKLSSWDCRNFPLIEAVAKTGKPVFVDLGPHLMGEVLQQVKAITDQDNENIVLMHTTHADKIEEYNLRAITGLREEFKYPVGWSAEGRQLVDNMALCLGANIIEKRLTLTPEYEGHHHVKALNPDEFKGYVGVLRSTEAILGKSTWPQPSMEDLRMKDLYFTSIVANRDIAKGRVIDPEDLAAKRPGNGVSPLYMNRFYGRFAQRDIEENELIRFEDAGY